MPKKHTFAIMPGKNNNVATPATIERLRSFQGEIWAGMDFARRGWLESELSGLDLLNRSHKQEHAKKLEHIYLEMLQAFNDATRATIAALTEIRTLYGDE